MSVTNEEVSGPAGNIGGGGSTPPPTSTSTVALSCSTGSSIHNGLSSTATSLSSPTFLPATPASTTMPFSASGTDDVVRCGYLRKLKGKKKFFVLRKETSMDKPARLEYYDKEKKFRSGQPPKKSIGLKACFNISRTDSKCKYSIALHTHNDCVRIAMSNEDEMNDWLRVMNSLAGEEEDQVDNLPQSIGKPHFEHIWLVTALNKGLGSKENIIGPYRLCLTSKEVTLLKVGEHDGRNGVVKFPLNVIRNVSHDATFGCFFHIELGRSAPTGPGLLSLKTEDNNIAQNMHLLILKAMQNYSKEDLIPRDRESRRPRTNTWNEPCLGSRTSSFHSSAPPQMTRINSIDGCMADRRIRTDSVSSSFSTRGFGMSPPMAIISQTPSFAFNSPLCSTGTDSASSSYSIDSENNNQHILHQMGNVYASENVYSKSHEDEESYVPYDPSDEQQTSLHSFNSLTLPLNPDASDYVETSLASKDSNSTAQTPSSYMEMQSPMSPFDNYMPMSPGCGSSSANLKNSVSGKVSISHSRNSSLIEEHDGYVPMNPAAHNNRCESGGCSTAGSTTGLDDQYLDMDFGRKLNLSNDDMRHMSPASSESIQSGTPSSDFPLEKVSSYLTDDFDDTNSMRPLRAYSVGSRSDTSSAGKNRGKNRLEAVQETFRNRAMSVGSKAKRPVVNQGTGFFASPGALFTGGKSPAPPLSSSWSGSTGRWPPNKLPNHMTQSQIHSQTSYPQPLHNHTGSESNDSDLMELDFSHNKSKSRKRSLPGPNGNHTASSSAGSGSSSVTKISPVPKGVLSGGSRDTPSKSDNGDTSKSTPPTATTTTCIINGVTTMPKYTSSAPISIQKSKANDVAYHDSIGSSILTKMTGMDLKKLKELDDDGAYLDMDFSNKSSEKVLPQKAAVSNHHDISSLKNNFLNRPVVVRPNESPTACKISRFSLNPSSSSVHDHMSSKAESASLVRSLSSSSNISSISNHSNSSSNSSMSVKTQQEVDTSCRTEISPKTSPLLHNSDHAAALSRIEECPEKLESRSLSLTPMQSPPRSPHHTTTTEEENRVTYAAIEHLPPVRRSYSLTPQAGPSTSSCGSSAVSAKSSGVTYAQIDFVKSPETIAPN
ncbi:unnamed protein product [Orchesella dallaii]|uniref:Insulin receptor substrate 1 n=1 Tax=Orchesella dallaii TaxID=48710 RepID=A0ABP1S5S9_9HEXA